MVATDKQIAANRLNAFKGGPKTEAGKAAVRYNAVTHGFYSEMVILKSEDRHLFMALRDQYYETYQPVDVPEEMQIELIISLSWRLRRVMATEQMHMGMAPDYRYESWEKLQKHLTFLQRQLYRAIDRLEAAQKKRLGKAVSLPPPPMQPNPVILDTEELDEEEVP